MMVSSSVDLPTPLRPSTARLPCSGNASETSCSTSASPYPARTLSSESSVSGMIARPEINFAHARISGDFSGRSLSKNRAPDQHDDVAGEAEHDGDVVLDKKQGEIAG